MSGSVVTVGSFMMDLVAYVERRPFPGETLKGTDFTMVPGGKGFNQAVAARRAGAESTMVGSLGTDVFGAEFLDTLASEGIDHDGVAQSPLLGTGVGLPVVSADGENAIIINNRANDLVDAAFMRQRERALAGRDILLLQLELPIDGNLEAARMGRELGLTVILTPAPAAPIDEFRGLVDYLVPNEIELAELAHGIEGTEAQARHLRSAMDARALIVTLGAQGAMVVTESDVHHLPAPRVVAVNTVGAGDTFCGNLAAKLAEGVDLLDAVRWAVSAASLSVTVKGSALSAPSRHEVESFMVAHAPERTVPVVR
jgi:ribokinase